jgi:hypothetical protein
MHALLELRMLLELDPLGLDQVSPQIHQLVTELRILAE